MEKNKDLVDVYEMAKILKMDKTKFYDSFVNEGYVTRSLFEDNYNCLTKKGIKLGIIQIKEIRLKEKNGVGVNIYRILQITKKGQEYFINKKTLEKL